MLYYCLLDCKVLALRFPTRSLPDLWFAKIDCQIPPITWNRKLKMDLIYYTYVWSLGIPTHLQIFTLHWSIWIVFWILHSKRLPKRCILQNCRKKYEYHALNMLGALKNVLKSVKKVIIKLWLNHSSEICQLLFVCTYIKSPQNLKPPCPKSLKP